MALVLLPCDLPTWPRVHRYLNELKTAQTSENVVDGMLRLHNLCCISLDSDEDNSTDSSRFSVFQKFLDSILTDDEKRKFFDVILPAIIESALQLKALKPPKGIHFSLQQQAEEFSLDRKLIRSLLAHAFFSTFPKRTTKTHPTLQDFNFSLFFTHLNSLSQQAKLRSFFRYYELIDNDDYEGYVTFSRKVNFDYKSQSVGDPWLKSDLPLCPLIVHHEGTIEDTKNDDIYQICFASPRLGGSVLTDGCDQEEIVFATCPELLVSLLCVESLENNETLIIHNWMRVGYIQDGRKFQNLDKSFDAFNSHMCLMDAGNFSNAVSCQYEEKNVLRELGKSLLGFSQPKAPRRLSPLGESCGTPPPEMWYSVCGTLDEPESFRVPRPTLIGQSFTSCSEGPKSPDKTLKVPEVRGRLMSQESEYQDALPYPCDKQKSEEGGDVWLTPLEPSKPLIPSEAIKHEEESAKTIRKVAHQKLSNQSGDSLVSDEDEYESCEEEELVEPDTPHSQGPVSSTGRLTLLQQPIPTVKRSTSSQSDADEDLAESHDLRRVPSTGFLLDEDDFVGDGLEVEQEWLRQFRNRSMSRSVSGISRRNSSRYSFSSDYSSDLDEIYEHFEEMMAKGPVSDDPAVAKYAGGLLKRTLSDSLTTARQSAFSEVMPRSLSLADHVTQEKKNLQLGKTADGGSDAVPEKGGKRKLSANLVSIVIEQTLEEVEAKMALASEKGDENRRHNLQKLYSQISVWWNYNKTYEFNVQLKPKIETEESDDIEIHPTSYEDVSACDVSLRRWHSEPDLRSLRNYGHCKQFRSPELSKWNATSNLFQSSLFSPSSPSSRSLSRKTCSLESVSQPQIDQSDSDQLWLIFDSKQSSSDDILSLNEDDSMMRRRVQSFSGSSNLTRSGLKRTTSDPELATTWSERYQSPSLFADRFTNLHVIDEVPHEESVTPHSPENVSGFDFSECNSCLHPEEGLVNRKDVCRTTDLESKIEIPISAYGYKPVATGNWGCGRLNGDPQLKAVIQWLAASQAELPSLVYFTQRNRHVVKLDIVNSVVQDRHWTVGTLMKVVLKYCNDKLENAVTNSLFDVILPRENH